MEKIITVDPNGTIKKLIEVLFFNETTKTKGKMKIQIPLDQDPLTLDFNMLEKVIVEALKLELREIEFFGIVNFEVTIYAFKVLTFFSIPISIKENGTETPQTISSQIESSDMYYVGGTLSVERHEVLHALKEDLAKLNKLPKGVGVVDTHYGIYPFVSGQDVFIKRTKLILA